VLKLTRRLGESIAIDDDITITVTKISGNSVQLGIKSPPGEHEIWREELLEDD
jgi:carbon storage regulator